MSICKLSFLLPSGYHWAITLMVWAQAKLSSCSVQGFRKSDPDLWQFSNDHFIRGRKDLLTEIQRKKTAAAGKEATAPGAAAIEVGPTGMADCT